MVIFLAYFTVIQLNLGDAMAIIFSSPVFTIIFEWIFVRRPKGLLLKLFVSLILLIGVVLIIQPPFLHFNSVSAIKTVKHRY